MRGRAVNLPVLGIPSFGIPAFGIPVFGIPDFGIPIALEYLSRDESQKGVFPYLRNFSRIQTPLRLPPTRVGPRECPREHPRGCPRECPTFTSLFQPFEDSA